MDDTDVLDRLRGTLDDLEVPSFALEAVQRRARTLRIHRLLSAGVAAAVLLAGVAVPLALLTRIGRGAPVPVVSAPHPTSPPSPSGSPAPPALPVGWVERTIEGVTIDAPQGWTFRAAPVPALVDPHVLFAIGTGSVPIGGSCAPTAVHDISSTGMLFWIEEWAHPVGKAVFDPGPLPRPVHLGVLSGPYECLGTDAYLISFAEAGRSFQVMAVFGPSAAQPLRDAVIRSLSSLRVVAAAPAQTQCPDPTPGLYAPTIAPSTGPSGASITVSGEVPTRAEDGSYVGPRGIVQVWWNVDPDLAWTVLPGNKPSPEPSPSLTGPPVLLGSVDVTGDCSYSLTLAVPSAPPGSYPVVLMGIDGGSAAVLGVLTFIVKS